MIDAHMHLEQGSYTYDWLMEFVKTAQSRGITEIWVLEHTHRFFEFAPLYEQVKEVNDLQRKWIEDKRLLPLTSYTNFIRDMRKKMFPITIHFGLEVCYFPQHEQLIRELLSEFDYDFVVGSIHFIDNMAYDLKGISEPTLWDAYDVDWIWKRYFELMEALIKSDLFDGTAHPDTLKMFNHMPTFDTTANWNKIADLLNKHHMYTENNVGCHYRYNHPDMGLNDKVLQIFKNHHVKLYCATDAHNPKYVGIHLDEIKNKTLYD